MYRTIWERKVLVERKEMGSGKGVNKRVSVIRKIERPTKNKTWQHISVKSTLIDYSQTLPKMNIETSWHHDITLNDHPLSDKIKINIKRHHLINKGRYTINIDCVDRDSNTVLSGSNLDTTELREIFYAATDEWLLDDEREYCFKKERDGEYFVIRSWHPGMADEDRYEPIKIKREVMAEIIDKLTDIGKYEETLMLSADIQQTIASLDYNINF